MRNIGVEDGGWRMEDGGWRIDDVIERMNVRWYW